MSCRLKSVNAQVLQQTLKQLDRAFADMKAKGYGFPRFKKKMRSFVFPAMLKNCLVDNRVKLPKFGWVRIRQSRPYPTGFEAKQARIAKKASGYYLMITFQSQEKIPEHPVGEKSIGLDAGIESFIATSREELIKAPKFLRDNLRKLKLLQRRLKNKIKGSNSWLRLQNRIARLHEKIANTRRDERSQGKMKLGRFFSPVDNYSLPRNKAPQFHFSLSPLAAFQISTQNL